MSKPQAPENLIKELKILHDRTVVAGLKLRRGRRYVRPYVDALEGRKGSMAVTKWYKVWHKRQHRRGKLLCRILTDYSSPFHVADV